MIDTSSMSIEAASAAAANKRAAALSAGVNNGNNFRAVKRRASKACQCCRARKVRCNVVEHGAPCTNCRLDEVECIITESKRRKKFWGAKVDTSQLKKDTTQKAEEAEAATVSIAAQVIPASPKNHSRPSDQELPHYLYNAAENTTYDTREQSYALSNVSAPSLTYSASTASSSYPYHASRRIFELPEFIKPTPSRIPVEDLEFLARKGALTIPDEPLLSELLRCHFEFVHPYMPLLDRKEFLNIVTGKAQSGQRVGLLLFQAVMFTGSGFADINALRAAGYTSRRAARKALFTKARLLYDFDHEQDRITLIQALLLMTYWFETPDDQKDTWHWMGVAISLSHTIGLHRNPENSMALDVKRKKLWKRIWWSCVMRDRLVALGMRRPTRIKGEDCDVPMLTLEDFEIDMDIGRSNIIYQKEDHEEEIKRQKQLAIMCIEKAKLCVCISHVLTAQYSVLNTNQGAVSRDGTTRTSMMLLPKQLNKDTCLVERCDRELQEWYAMLPEEATHKPMALGLHPVDQQITLHTNLLHMVYFTTISALHRPQVLPSAPAPWPSRNTNATLQEISRRKVRQASSKITHLARELVESNLVRYLPTTGVTVMLPAIIIHLLDIKSSNPFTRERSLESFSLCMEVMQGLRQSYASADYASHFLEAAIKKADIQVVRSRRKWTASEQDQEPLRKRRRTMDDKDCEMSGSEATDSNGMLSTSDEGEDGTFSHSRTSSPPESIAIAIDENSDTAMIFQSPSSITDHDQRMADALDAAREKVMKQSNESITISNDEPTFPSVMTSISISSDIEGHQATSMLLNDDNALALKIESFLATTPPSPPSNTTSPNDMEDNPERDSDSTHLSGHEFDSIFSPTSPPTHIRIPDDDCSMELYMNQDNNNDNPGCLSTKMEAILGREIDPFLGHYEDGTEISFQNFSDENTGKTANCNNNSNIIYSRRVNASIGNDGYKNGFHTATMLENEAAGLLGIGGGSLFGNGNWMEGGADMENVGKLLDGMDFELEDMDVIQVFES